MVQKSNGIFFFSVVEENFGTISAVLRIFWFKIFIPHLQICCITFGPLLIWRNASLPEFLLNSNAGLLSKLAKDVSEQEDESIPDGPKRSTEDDDVVDTGDPKPEEENKWLLGVLLVGIELLFSCWVRMVFCNNKKLL